MEEVLGVRIGKKYGIHVEENVRIVVALFKKRQDHQIHLNATIIILLLVEGLKAQKIKWDHAGHAIGGLALVPLVGEGNLGCLGDRNMKFQKDLGVISCRCVVFDKKPVHFVSHAGGDWQFYCSDKAHDFNSSTIEQDLVLVGVVHLIEDDPTLDELSILPVDMGAERECVGGGWQLFEDKDD